MEVIIWLIDGLNGNAGAITGIATVVLVGITGYYAWVTKKMLDENRQMRIDAQKPDIAIYLHLEKKIPITHIYLYVENIGMAPARDVKFNIDPSFSLPGDKSLQDANLLNLVNLGIGYFPPGRQRKCLLANEVMAGFSDLMQKQLKITTTYKDSASRKYKNSFCLDFREQ